MNINILQPSPTPKTNMLFVDSLEEFEKIELELNESIVAFDKNKEKQTFYAKERDRHGEYSPVMIYFYENFAQKIENLEREEFKKRCKKVGLDELKTECACLFFLENKTPQDVWLWLLDTKKKDIEWDSVKIMKYRLKCKLFPEMVKHKQKVNNQHTNL